MDIKQLNEKISNLLSENVEEENEHAEMKRSWRIYTKAHESLEELQELLVEGIDPSTGKLDADTDAFYNQLTDMINEIHSRSLAFEV